MASIISLFRQFFPSAPPWTENALPPLQGKVFIITGGYSGIGLQLAALLFRAGATVYLAGRSEGPARTAIKRLEAEQNGHGHGNGRLEFLKLQLDDLSSIPGSVDRFLQRETRLDVLWNNAGVHGGEAVVTKQGHEIHIGTNNLGHFLFTKLLHPLLASTAAASPSKGSVRVVWLSSLVAHLQAPRGGGMDLERLEYRKPSHGDHSHRGVARRYAVSKVGAVFLGAEWARRDAQAGIVHLSCNPGNLKTPLQRNLSAFERSISNMVLYDPVYGAYTELWAGLSPDITPSDSGRYVVPWGRFGAMRADIEAEMREGKARKAFRFYEFCERATAEWVMESAR